MAYLHCARCDLQIKIQAPLMHIDNCPRCLARTATISPMTLSASRPAIGRAGDRHEPFVLSLIHSDPLPHDDRASRLTALGAGAPASDVVQRAKTRRVGTTRRAHQGAMAAAVRALRSHQRPRDPR